MSNITSVCHHNHIFYRLRASPVGRAAEAGRRRHLEPKVQVYLQSEIKVRELIEEETGVDTFYYRPE